MRLRQDYVGMSLRLGCLLWLFACIPMGVPEYFSGMDEGPGPKSGFKQGSRTREMLALFGEGQAPAQPLLLVFPKRPLSKHLEETLGTQFLLGVIPFTRLYLQHGSEVFLEEIIVDLLRAEGFRPLLVRSDQEKFSALSLPVAGVLKVRPDSLSVIAYDALFFRVLSASGNFSLSLFSFGNNAIERQREKQIEVSNQEFSTQGHAPELSLLLRNSIRDATRAPLKEMLVSLASARGSNTLTAKEPILILDSPELLLPNEGAITKAVLDSYGFQGMPEASPRVLQRIVQRGLELGIESLEIPWASELSGERVEMLSSGVWRLQTRVRSILEEKQVEVRGVRLDVELRVIESNRSVIMYGRCRQFIPFDSGADGYWVVALEEGLESFAKAIFEKDSKAGCELANDNSPGAS